MEAARVLIDTSILIDYFRKTDKSKSVWHQLNRRKVRFCASVITKFEIYSGITNQQKAFWDEIFLQIRLYEVNETAIDAVCEFHRELKLKNQLIEFNDLVIATTAVLNNLPLPRLT